MFVEAVPCAKALWAELAVVGVCAWKVNVLYVFVDGAGLLELLAAQGAPVPVLLAPLDIARETGLRTT